MQRVGRGVQRVGSSHCFGSHDIFTPHRFNKYGIVEKGGEGQKQMADVVNKAFPPPEEDTEYAKINDFLSNSDDRDKEKPVGQVMEDALAYGTTGLCIKFVTSSS